MVIPYLLQNFDRSIGPRVINKFLVRTISEKGPVRAHQSGKRSCLEDNCLMLPYVLSCEEVNYVKDAILNS